MKLSSWQQTNSKKYLTATNRQRQNSLQQTAVKRHCIWKVVRLPKECVVNDNTLLCKLPLDCSRRMTSMSAANFLTSENMTANSNHGVLPLKVVLKSASADTSYNVLLMFLSFKRPRSVDTWNSYWSNKSAMKQVRSCVWAILEMNLQITENQIG